MLKPAKAVLRGAWPARAHSGILPHRWAFESAFLHARLQSQQVRSTHVGKVSLLSPSKVSLAIASALTLAGVTTSDAGPALILLRGTKPVQSSCFRLIVLQETRRCVPVQSRSTHRALHVSNAATLQRNDSRSKPAEMQSPPLAYEIVQGPLVSWSCSSSI